MPALLSALAKAAQTGELGSAQNSIRFPLMPPLAILTRGFLSGSRFTAASSESPINRIVLAPIVATPITLFTLVTVGMRASITGGRVLSPVSYSPPG